MKILKNTIQVRKREMLIAFNDMIACMLSNKKFNQIVTEFSLQVKN